MHALNVNLLLDIDYCTPNPCQNGGACTYGLTTYTCACLAGYTDFNCERSMCLFVFHYCRLSITLSKIF